MNITVQFEQQCIHSEMDDEPYGSWSESYCSRVVDVWETRKDEKPAYDTEFFVIADDSKYAFVVFMLYSDGDSFGSSNGKINIIHCTSSEEKANQLAKLIDENRDEFIIKFVDEFGKTISFYNPGAGFFETIDSINMERFEIASKSHKAAQRRARKG